MAEPLHARRLGEDEESDQAGRPRADLRADRLPAKRDASSLPARLAQGGEEPPTYRHRHEIEDGDDHDRIRKHSAGRHGPRQAESLEEEHRGEK